MLCGMGFDVSVDAVLLSSPKGHVLDVLGDHFEAIEHAPGSKNLTVTEHVSMNDEDDAKAFVQSLVAEALPDGAKILAVRAVADPTG